MTDFFYIRATPINTRSKHRVGAIAYTINQETQTITLGSSVVHPKDRTVKFNPIGCKWRAIQKRRDTPMTMTFDMFRASNPHKLVTSLGIAKFLINWEKKGWAINYKHLDTIGSHIIQEIDGKRSDGNPLAMKAK